MIDWRHWHNEPWLIGGLVVAGWLWAVAAGPARTRLAPGVVFPRSQAIQFYLGLLSFYPRWGRPSIKWRSGSFSARTCYSTSC
jgi:putative membrane protein